MRTIVAMPPSALYVAFDVFPRAKGSTAHIASMVRGLARNFGAVRLLCLGSPEMPGYQREGGVEIFRFRERRPNLLRRATAFARFVAAHTRELAGRLDLAAFRDPWGGYPLLRSGPRCPTLFEVNALPSWELAYSRPDLTGNAALFAKLRDMERYCLRRSARVTCVSPVLRRALAGEGVSAESVEVIPNAASGEFFQAESLPCPITELREGRWFGYIGGLQPWQGVETAIDGFAQIAQDMPDSRMLILHGGAPRSVRGLERRIAKHGLPGRVLVRSSLAPHEVAGALARLRFTVAALADTARNTQQGCCPVKVVESMAAGVPVIASDLAVCRAWIAHERDGLLATADDARAWALAMRRMLADPSLAARLGAAARETAHKHFSWSVVHDRLDVLFRTTAAGRSSEVVS